MTKAFMRLHFILLAAVLTARAESGYYRYPALHAGTLVFTAEGDLWRVSAAGGTAARLTSHPGEEWEAAISPDGTRVAFVGQYEGPEEVYVMPLSGGLPKRLTYGAGDPRVRGWTPDGRVICSTFQYSTLPDARLVLINPDTLGVERVPLAQANLATYDDDQRVLYFTRYGFQGSQTNHYVGGTAENLWRFKAGDSEAVPLTQAYPGTSRTPMWWRGRLYFVSDRDGVMNLWSIKPDGSDPRQHTFHKEFGIRSASLSDGRIAYQQGADLWIYDIGTNRTAVVPIALESDFDQTRERWVSKPAEAISAEALSPDGDRVVLTVRGQVVVVPTGQGRIAVLPRQLGTRYRDAAFMPDGKSVALLSDESGEVEFWTAPANGLGAVAQLSHGSTNLKTDSLVSPDGKSIAYIQRDQTIGVLDVASGQSRQVARSPYQTFSDIDLAWSPDSRWLAYSDGVKSTDSVVFLWDSKTGLSTPVTSERVNSSSPAFSPDGKWLYFLSERAFHSAVPGPWGNNQPEPYFDNPVKVYALALDQEERSPFSADTELTEAQKKPEPAATDPKEAPKAPAVLLDGIIRRLWEVPIPAGRYDNLRVTDKALYLTDTSAPDAEGKTHTKLLAVEIKRRDVKAVTLRSDIKSYDVSADGKKLLFHEDDHLYVTDAGVNAIDSLDDAEVNLDGLKLSFSPRDDWRQMLVDAWRMHRDYFYDKGMHGVDWKASLARALPLLDRVSDRSELDDLLAYMVAEISALHTFVFTDDLRKGPDDVGVGSLAADLLRDQGSGGYRISRIYGGNPDYLDNIGPLGRPGLDVRPGDVLVAINGQPTLSAPDPSALLRNAIGRQTLIALSRPGAKEPIEKIVIPVDGGRAEALRYADWEEERRTRVEEASAGSIGYVHLRGMEASDIEQWERDYYPVRTRQGLIVDLRHNTGGDIDAWLLSRLAQKPWMWWAPRDGVPISDPVNAAPPHIVILVDAWTASDGETMANGARELGIAKLIGVRTWGGGIWLSYDNTLVDGGIASAPETGTFISGKGWVVENKGVTPDYVVDNAPAATFRGEDAQLDAAVKLLLEEIKSDPRPIPTPPPYPTPGAPRP